MLCVNWIQIEHRFHKSIERHQQLFDDEPDLLDSF